MLDPAVAPALRVALAEAGFDESGVHGALGVGQAIVTPRPDSVTGLVARVGSGTPLQVLVRLFVLASPVSSGQARLGLGTLGLDDAVDAGLVAVNDDLVSAGCRLTPARGVVLASDPRIDRELDLPRDHVPGVAFGALPLADLTVRRPVTRALDLGAGSGFQTVLAAAHADHVVATDINPRAFDYLRFNVALADVEPRVEARLGDLWEPVLGERFDLIVSNPPSAIAPTGSLLFRGGLRPGHDMSATVVEGAAHHLEPGGLAHVTVTWGRPSDSDAFEVPRGWVPEGNDALILHFASHSSVEYTAAWLLPTQVGEAADWHDYHHSLGFDLISYGAVVLRRTDGDPQVRIADADPVAGPALAGAVAELITAPAGAPPPRARR